MDVFEAVQQRKSIRSYQDKPIAHETLERILEAARLSPSAVNRQPWHFIVVTEKAKRKALSRGAFAKFLIQAPVVIVACGDKKASPDWYAVDTSLAVENMVLTAVNEALGTCCVGSFNDADVKMVLNIPNNFEVLVMIAVGYPKEKVDISSKLLGMVRKRKNLSEVVSEEEFGKPFLTQRNTQP